MRFLGFSKLATVAVAAVAMCTTDASAWSRGSYGSYGSSGSYSSYGSSGSSASYGSYGSHGRVGLFARWHARKAAKASHGSYGSYASYGSSGSYSSYGSSGSYSSYGSYGGSYASSGSYGGGYYHGGVEVAPMEAQPAIEGAPAEATPPTPPQPAEPPQASIRVKVPADATVFVNDRPTTSKGENRHYISRNLLAGRTYAYDLRVEYTLDGKPMVENKTVRLQAGSAVDLTFGSGEQVAGDAEEAKTKVTLHVPAEAKVTLAGAETRQTGETRTFVTTSLKNGQKWDGYVVRVELERDGKTLTEEKHLSIEGGKSYELSFDFADASSQIAVLN